MQEAMMDVRIHLLRMMQLIPFKERNRHNVPAHCAQQSITQARVAKWLKCICGKVRRAVDLECNPPIHNRQINAKKPIRRDVLGLV